MFNISGFFVDYCLLFVFDVLLELLPVGFSTTILFYHANQSLDRVTPGCEEIANVNLSVLSGADFTLANSAQLEIDTDDKQIVVFVWVGTAVAY